MIICKRRVAMLIVAAIVIELVIGSIAGMIMSMHEASITNEIGKVLGWMN